MCWETAGYAFSDIAGNTAVIVKLTRTLFIIPCVIILSLINERKEAKLSGIQGHVPLNLKKVFPYFIIMFLIVVALRSTGIIPTTIVPTLSKASKFCMVVALSAIGLKTSYSDIRRIGFKPMILGFIIDTLVVFVSIGVQIATDRF
ncbi:integral membrane protein [Alkalibaculum bacchi]|uniref:Integral membrane protein n=1 Tax=Alkalibaculum bacchi TaxID=645887 RepID=A0A366HXG0_9FIRM|nr:putative sulfate exporter family transporter [Alkalibaculum bacchi]RBP57548.1 integral membrane protein [Alkalibaculum bacchi]